MRIITFSLFGDKKIYCQGAVENAKLAKLIYPDWVARFYVSQTVPIQYVHQLLSHDAEVFYCKQEDLYDGLVWRFKPFIEDNVSAWISRDCDSRLNWREKEAVDEWLESDKSVHLMRDSHNHGYTMMAGMFGVNNDLFHARYGKLDFDKWKFAYPLKKESDQVILNLKVWPLIANDHLCHDHWRHNKPTGNPTTKSGDHVSHKDAYGIGLIKYITEEVYKRFPEIYPPDQDSRPFPQHKPLDYGIFIGQVIDEHNKPKINTDVRWEYELRGIQYE